MPLDPPTPGSPEDWLRHARSDLALAQQRQVPDVLLATLCFHAQQTAEKSLKAVLVQRGVAFPYTHDLARLITLAQSVGLPWPEALDAAATLTVYAAGSRYPGPGGEILDAEYRQATALAQRVLDWAEFLIRGPAENEVTEGHA
jgi:HEPN domain-containing protein